MVLHEFYRTPLIRVSVSLCLSWFLSQIERQPFDPDALIPSLYEDAAAKSMATSSSETQSPAKKFRCSHAFFVDEIASKFGKREFIFSDPFYCLQDSASPAFASEIGFDDEKTDFISAYLHVKGDAYLNSVRFVFHDHEWKVLKSRKNQIKGGWGWPEFMSRDELKSTEQTGLHIAVEVEYEAVVDSTPPLRSQISEDFLLKFEDEDDKDVTFLVEKEKIKAHKVVLTARCPYFRTMFKCGMKESVTNEVNVPDIAPEVFKEMLKFIYSGIAPEFHKEVSVGLLVSAAKYGLEDLKEHCELTLASHLGAENVVEYLLLADDHDCPTLLEKASLVLRSHLRSIATERMRKLERNPALLRRLLKLGYPDFDSDTDAE